MAGFVKYLREGAEEQICTLQREVTDCFFQPQSPFRRDLKVFACFCFSQQSTNYRTVDPLWLASPIVNDC